MMTTENKPKRKHVASTVPLGMETSNHLIASLRDVKKLQVLYDEIAIGRIPTRELRRKLLFIKIQIGLRKKNMSKAQLCKLMGIKVSTLQYITKGDVELTIDRLVIIEEALDLHLLNY